MILATNPLATDPLAGLAAAGVEPPPDPPPPVEGGTVSFELLHPAHVTRIRIEFACDADGEAEATSSFSIDGKLIQVSVIPGDPAPANNFDVFLFDDDRHDLLLGAGRNLSSTAQTGLSSNQLAAAAGTALTLTVINGGDSGSGTVLVYVR